MGGRPGYIFEIFQNGHIFLKILFFFKYKKEKDAERDGWAARPKHSRHYGLGRHGHNDDEAVLKSSAMGWPIVLVL